MARTTDGSPEVARAYVVAVTLLVFFVLWATVAANPFPHRTAGTADAATPATDPRTLALQRREQAYNRRAIAARRVIDARWKRYRHQVAQRRAENRRTARANAADRASAARAAAAARVASYSAPRPSYAPAVQVASTPAPAVTHTATS